MTWDAVRVAALTAAPVLLAAGFWLSYSAMGALFGPSPVPYLPPAAVSSPPAPAKAHHPPPSPHHRLRRVPRAVVAPVTAVPVRSRQPARTVTPSPAWTTPTATQSVPPTPTPTDTPAVPPTATTAPPTATPSGTPPLPGDGSGT